MTSEKFTFKLGRHGQFLRFGIFQDGSVDDADKFEWDMTPERAINLGRSLMENGMALKVQLEHEEDQRVPRYTKGD